MGVKRNIGELNASKKTGKGKKGLKFGKREESNGNEDEGR